MLFRKRVYKIPPEMADDFNHYFNRFVHPVQMKYGAKLVGRWTNEGKTEVTAIWQYAGLSHYEEIQKHVAADPLSRREREECIRVGLDLSMVLVEEEFIGKSIDE
ncbi:NIPSNAP family protein [Salinithrix halophila]|uniref:NIPSNAP family protein n=1 Tax=Salinithrix halophila TaxID=1485204 RepID=A0ABV8JLT1_9BACL